jgi:hypothetical protein
MTSAALVGKPWAKSSVVDGLPGLGACCGHGSNVQQTAQLAGPAFGESPSTVAMPRVIRAGIEPGKRNEGIRIAKGQSLEVDQYTATDDRAHAGMLSRRV